MLDDDMKAIIVQANLSFVATVNDDGSPNLSPKSTLQVHDDNHLIFANLASPGTIDNLRREARTEINCIDVFSRRGYRFTGSASVHSPGEALYEEFNQTLKRQLGPDTTMYDAVLIKLEDVKPILSPAYASEGVTEEGLRKTYLRKYGVTAEMEPVT